MTQIYLYTSILHGYGDIKPQTLDTCKWQSINGRACAHTSSDRNAQKIVLLCGTGSYVPNLVKMSPQITSQSCPQTYDGRTDVYVILYSVQCYALHNWTDNKLCSKSQHVKAYSLFYDLLSN